jgi:hypothetical protein
LEFATTEGEYNKSNVFGFNVVFPPESTTEDVCYIITMPLVESGVGVHKTLDAFDFSVEHLSIYERR